MVLFPQGKSAWSITVPEDTINYFKSPSFENATTDTETKSANVTPTYSTAWSWRGLYSRLISISSTAANFFAKRLTASSGVLDTAGVNYCFSCYVYSPAAENFQLEVRTSLDAFAAAIATTTFKATGGDNRFYLAFTTPSGVSTSTTYEFRLVRTNATTNSYYTDAWQIEQKNYPTTYCDGDQPGCVWIGSPNSSISKRPLWLYSSNSSQVIGGRTYNLNDLQILVQAYQGAGTPPIQHTSQKRALQGGDFYQRSLPSFRVFSLVCTFSKANLQQLQSLREALITYVSPDVVSQQDRPLLLGYQTVDACGNQIGKALEVPVLYLGGLEGNVDNLQQDTFTLQFTEYSPPSIQEQRELATTLSFAANAGAAGRALIRSADGSWSANTAGVTTVYAVLYDLQGRPWLLDGDVRLFDNSVIQGFTGSPTAGAMAVDAANNVYAGGDFTSAAGNYIIFYNGSVWAQVGATINAGVFALQFDATGLLYAAGAFTAPGNRIGYWDGAAWNAIGTGLNATGYALAMGLDGTLYVGGDFTTANGTSANRIAKFTGTTFTALGSGTNSTVYSIVVGPDGTIYAGGNFTTAGGVSCNYVAKWNGTQWQPLGAGLNNAVKGLAIGPDGTLYAVGTFTALGNGAYPITGGLARWNGTTWLPGDIIKNGAAVPEDVRINAGGDILAAFNNATLTATGAVTTVAYAGSAGTYPKFKITGPGQLYQLTNNTTGKNLYFNYTLLASEVLTLNTDPKNFSFTSTVYGNVIGKILPGSDVTGFGLTPGNNRITALISGTTTAATQIQMLYRNTHWSMDASGAL